MKSSPSSKLSDWFSGLERWAESGNSVYFIMVLAICLSYGYELFNFNITIDEEIRSNQMGMWVDWLVQGRWGMAALNYLIVPNPVVPSVSLFLGLLGASLGLVALLKTSFSLDRLGLVAIAALAVTIPTLPFSLTFSTLAYGVGFGFVALAIANWLVYQQNWRSIILASLLAGFAIGVYQTFVFVVAMLFVVQVWRLHAVEKAGVLASIKYPTIFLIGGIVLYWLINLIALKAMNLEIKYVGQFIDIQGFFQDPIARLTSSFRRAGEIFSINPNRFGIRSIWLGHLLQISLLFTVIYPLYKRNYRLLAWMCAIVIAMIGAIIAANAIAQNAAPLRSVIYIPVAIAVVVACAYMASGRMGKLILISFCGLAVIGNSQVNNHLFASSAEAELQDRLLAQAIISEVRKLRPDNADKSPLKIEVIGNHAWPISGVHSRTETFGASFFEWDGGNRHRVAAFLNINGLPSVGGSEAERASVHMKTKKMPAWPHAGWVAMVDDILVIKFGEYSNQQKASLCAQSIAELCRNP